MRKQKFKCILFTAPLIVAPNVAECAVRQDIDTGTQTSSENRNTINNVSDSDSDHTRDIVVTATRRSESLNKVPISVVAMTQADLTQQGIRNVSDLSYATPSVQFREGNRQSANFFSIRGVTSNVGASTTGVYIDDTPIQARALGAGGATGTFTPALFDIDRVEVLRGPQGTLFGSGSQGGTIRFLYPDASLTRTSGEMRSELGFTEGGDPSYEIGAALGGPVIDDKVALRASGYFRHNGGWIDRVPASGRDDSDKNENSGETKAFRLAAQIEVGDLKILPSLFYQSNKYNGTNLFWSTLSDPANGKFISGYSIRENGKDRVLLPQIKIELEEGSITLISNTSYFDRKQRLLNDYTAYIDALLSSKLRLVSAPGLPDAYTVASFPQYQKSFTQEFRIQSNNRSRLAWVIGGFYQRSHQGTDQILTSTEVDATVLALTGGTIVQGFGQPALNGNSLYVSYDASIDKQAAIFGQADFNFTDWLKATAGFRYAHTEFNFTNRQNGPLNGPVPTGATGNQSERPFTPKFGISIQPDPNTLIYATIAKGVRPGGANAAISTVACASELAAIGITSAPDQFQSDSVWSYEVGAKTALFDRKVHIATSAFYIDWTKIQQRVGLTCGFQYNTNLGSATSKGADLQLDISPVEGLRLSGDIAYTDGTYSDDAFGGVTNSATGARAVIVRKGDHLNAVPWAVTLSASYEFEAGKYQPYIRVDYSYNSGFKSGGGPGAANFDPITYYTPAVSFLNARTGIVWGDLDVSLFVNNLFNSADLTVRSRLVTGSSLFRESALRPRTAGATVSYRF